MKPVSDGLIPIIVQNLQKPGHSQKPAATPPFEFDPRASRALQGLGQERVFGPGPFEDRGEVHGEMFQRLVIEARLDTDPIRFCPETTPK